MPSLPDVEVFRLQTGLSSLHRPVERVRAPDPEVLDGTGDRPLTRTLRDRTFEGASRHGRHLFLEVAGGGVLAVDFGPTGHPATGRVGDAHHVRLVVSFADGGVLSLLDHDRSSRVALTSSMEEYVAAHRIGPDALTMPADRLRELVRASKDGIWETLTDETRIAGLGDVYTDEILFQARIDPRTPGRATDDHTCGKLHRTLHRVLALAVKRDADPTKVPRTWLLPHREHGARCPRGNGRVHQFRAGGRIGYWCPGCQSG